MDEIQAASIIIGINHRVRFNTEIDPIQLLDVENTPATRLFEVSHNLTNNQGCAQSSGLRMEIDPSPSILSTRVYLQVSQRLKDLETLVERISGYPIPMRKTPTNSFTDTPFIDGISMLDLPHKFHLPSFRIYDETTYPGNHMAQYKQMVFTTSIPNDIR